MIPEAFHPLPIIPELYPKTLPKAILFDWDNTLVDTWRVSYDALNMALKGLGQDEMTLDVFWKNPHLSMRDAGRHLFGDDFEEGERLFHEAVQQLHLQELIVLHGVEPLLGHLGTRDIYIGVVSNKEGHILRKEVAHLGWDPHFQRVIGSRDAAADKPSHLPVLAALHESMIDPGHEVWFVGDSIVDVQCARASGCIPVVVGQGEASQESDIIHAKDCFGLAQLIGTL